MAKKNLKTAASLLKMQWGYKDGRHADELSFDFVQETDRIEVFNAGGKYDDVFYWSEDVCKVAEVCGLRVYAGIYEIDGSQKVVMVLH